MKKYLNFLLQPPITRLFLKKLKHNFHTLTPVEMIIYFVFMRPFWSKRQRFFFEGSLGLLGQLYVSERKALYETITEFKPRQCFEIGTYTGGGSTYFIGAALDNNDSGMLYTIENNSHYYNKAINYFPKKLPKINKHIKFMLADHPSAFDEYLKEFDKVDFVFFDGAEDGKQTLEQYDYFKPYLKTGSVIAFHDWHTEKTIAVKPVISEDPSWKLIKEVKPPHSVGLAVFIHE